MIFDIASELIQQGIDACTLNNALNIAQLYALAILIRLLRSNERGDANSRK